MGTDLPMRNRSTERRSQLRSHRASKRESGDMNQAKARRGSVGSLGLGGRGQYQDMGGKAPWGMTSGQVDPSRGD